MKSRSAASTLFGFALLAGIAYALWYVARLGAGMFDGLFDGIGRETTMILATAALTVLLAAWIVARGLHAIARRHERLEQRAGRAAAYDLFLRVHAEPSDDPFGAAAYLEREAAAGPQLLLHASPAVVSAYARLRRAEASGAAGHDEMAELMKAMRRDLGQRAPDAPLADIAELLGSPAPERVG